MFLISLFFDVFAIFNPEFFSKKHVKKMFDVVSARFVTLEVVIKVVSHTVHNTHTAEIIKGLLHPKINIWSYQDFLILLLAILTFFVTILTLYHATDFLIMQF